MGTGCRVLVATLSSSIGPPARHLRQVDRPEGHLYQLEQNRRALLFVEVLQSINYPVHIPGPVDMSCSSSLQYKSWCHDGVTAIQLVRDSFTKITSDMYTRAGIYPCRSHWIMIAIYCARRKVICMTGHGPLSCGDSTVESNLNSET